MSQEDERSASDVTTDNAYRAELTVSTSHRQVYAAQMKRGVHSEFTTAVLVRDTPGIVSLIGSSLYDSGSAQQRHAHHHPRPPPTRTVPGFMDVLDLVQSLQRGGELQALRRTSCLHQAQEDDEHPLHALIVVISMLDSLEFARKESEDRTELGEALE